MRCRPLAILGIIKKNVIHINNEVNGLHNMSICHIIRIVGTAKSVASRQQVRSLSPLGREVAAGKALSQFG